LNCIPRGASLVSSQNPEKEHSVKKRDGISFNGLRLGTQKINRAFIMKQISIKTLGRTIVTGLLALAGILPVAQTASGSTCVTPPSSLAAWWQAEGNTSCGVNGFAPTPVGNLTYSNGEVGFLLRW
jgi:hypothetical protein